MIRCFSFATVAAAGCLLTGTALAGSPPFLSLPIDGVAADNVEVCSKLLNARLEHKSNAFTDSLRGVQVIERSGQYYLAFYMDEDVRLSELTAALKSSEFSIPVKRLHLYGHITLEIDAPVTSHLALASNLGELAHVSASEPMSDRGRMQLTIDMPYPVDTDRPDWDAIGWSEFRVCDFNSEHSKSAKAMSVDQLPGYQSIRDAISKHGATLTDLRWNVDHACRPLGGTALVTRKQVAKAVSR